MIPSQSKTPLRALSLTVLAAALLALLANACSSDDCAATSSCAGQAAVPMQDASVDGARAYPEVPPPAGCDPAKDSKDSPACVADVYALFVDAANGSNAGKGTRAAPFRSIDAATNIDALAGRPRIYLCGTAPYAESVRLPANISLFGGFECGTWNYSSARATIAPTSAQTPALRVDGSSKGVVLADLEITAKDGEGNGGSSVAVFVNASKATLRRVGATAGTGAKGTTLPTPTNHSATPPIGETTTTANGAAAKTCACVVRGASTGGKGGVANGAGQEGSIDPLVPGRGGTAGTGGATCTVGGTGKSGIVGGVGGRRASALGRLSAEGWVPGRGGDGAPGDPGAGGGGAGGNSATGGGGGACGGCGGSAGTGGAAGGSSIALAQLDADVTLVESTLASKQAGDGATGGSGEAGATGGFGGIGACTGGDGGNGTGGGGGAGGAGGLSAAVVKTGGSLAEDPASKLTSGFGGGRGGRGAPGGGAVPGGDSDDGLEVLSAASVVEIQ